MVWLRVRGMIVGLQLTTQCEYSIQYNHLYHPNEIYLIAESGIRIENFRIGYEQVKRLAWNDFIFLFFLIQGRL